MHLLSRISIYKYFFILCWSVAWCDPPRSKRTGVNPTLISSHHNQSRSSIEQPESMEAWGPWGPWSPCSRTCGGGVAVQERFCLPIAKNRWHRDRRRRRLPSVITAQSSETANNNTQCKGLSRRYHECNTLPCQGPVQDPRAQQCAAFDSRPFRGRYFNWLPFVDGSAPCQLNCRPLGHHFYASLGLVTDGTPCSKPPYRAICIRGQCKAVGHEGVLSVASGKYPTSCGRRLVSGLFTKPRLPLGYNPVATVPAGACNLNVTELTASDNYLALKVTNGSFVLNGDFAISPAGYYEAAGARFTYKRDPGAAEVIFTPGPLHQPVDIMILYRHPNPAIKYEYFVDGTPIGVGITNDILDQTWPTTNEDSAHKRRSHNNIPPIRDTSLPNFDISIRRFVWKSSPFTKCSRDCGGGIQISKWKCYEDGTMAEASATQCPQPPPAAKRRKCNSQPCPPRWRVFAWSDCPSCGPGKSTRKVVCVREHTRTVITVPDRECETTKPPTEKECQTAQCPDPAPTTDLPTTNGRRQTNTKTELFRDSPVVTRYSNDTTLSNDRRNDFNNDIHQTSFGVGSWVHTEWTECIGWCGSGIRSRHVLCNDGDSCLSSNAPVQYDYCEIRASCDTGKPQPIWLTGPWSECSSPCPWGRKVRVVVCASSLGRRLRDSVCANLPKPNNIESCQGLGICQHDWLIGEWGDCQGACGSSVAVRLVRCDGNRCILPSPPATRPCASSACYPQDVPRNPTFTTSATLNTPRLTRHHETIDATTPISPHEDRDENNCEDMLGSCSLAVRARLCQYPYYTKFCCRSCNENS